MGDTRQNGAYGATANRAQVPTYSPGRGAASCVAKDGERWTQEGRLPYLRTLGGHRRYPEVEIRALVETLSEPSVVGQQPAWSA